MTSQRRNEGFGLIEAIVTLIIVGIAGYAIQSILTLSFRGSAHADLRLSLRSLAETLNDRVDCTKTLAQVTNASVDCAATNPKVLLLKDAANNTITGAVNPLKGAFNPLDYSLAGAAPLGSWYLRAYCQSPGTTLVVRFAKYSGNAFSKDPFTKRQLDWQNSDTNPLYGTQDRALCSTATATAPPPTNAVQRLAILRVAFTILNNGTERITIDLTKTPPSVTSAVSATLGTYSVSAPFNNTSTMRMTAALERVDVRNPYSNVTTTSPLGILTAAKGLVTVGLSSSGDIGYDSAPFGTAVYTLTVFQNEP